MMSTVYKEIYFMLFSLLLLLLFLMILKNEQKFNIVAVYCVIFGDRKGVSEIITI